MYTPTNVIIDKVCGPLWVLSTPQTFLTTRMELQTTKIDISCFKIGVEMEKSYEVKLKIFSLNNHIGPCKLFIIVEPRMMSIFEHMLQSNCEMLFSVFILYCKLC